MEFPKGLSKPLFGIAVLGFVMVCVFVLFAFLPSGSGKSDNFSGDPQQKEIRIDRKQSELVRKCIECHGKESRGIIADWAGSRHAHANVDCLDCHGVGAADKDVSTAHLSFDDTKISAIVSPKDCSRCHPGEAAQFAKSKHANTIEIMWKTDSSLHQGINSEIEQATGCDQCHGSIIKPGKGGFDFTTWPNVGIGRVNPDGSKGSCTSCHTRHKFSLSEARKPEACTQCHQGADYPQSEIFFKSKHGSLYLSEGDSWRWDSPPGMWTPGTDFRAPTCASCHMSAAGEVQTSHNVSERLAWELQTPLSVRPRNFEPWPSETHFREDRVKMETVCRSCHATAWIRGHFTRFDQVVLNYNSEYYKPAQEIIDSLYAKHLINPENSMDEKIEIDLYELWHRDGRHVRFGSAMMGPDYVKQGYYEMKKRFMAIEDEAARLNEEGSSSAPHKVRGSLGN